MNIGVAFYKNNRDYKISFQDIKNSTTKNNYHNLNDIDKSCTCMYWTEYYGYRNYDYISPDVLQTIPFIDSIRYYRAHRNGIELSYIKYIIGCIKFNPY